MHTTQHTLSASRARALSTTQSEKILRIYPEKTIDKTIRNSDFVLNLANMATKLLLVALGLPFACSAPSRAAALLTPMAYAPLPVGSVIPDGWLRLQLGILSLQ